MTPLRKLLPLAGLPFGIAATVFLAGKAGFSPASSSALGGVGLSGGQIVGVAHQPGGTDFERTERPGSVDIALEYDISELAIPEQEIHTLLPRDAIPALVEPITESVDSASEWLDPSARVIVVQNGGETYAAPIAILNYHEIVNTTVGGEPVAITYCPLCDSATVFSRRVEDAGGNELVLEWGVSGALYNSNVLMYDQETLSLWSQLAMRGVSGSFAGTELDVLPIRVISLAALSKLAPDAQVTSRNTGYQRPYEGEGYRDYFESDRIIVDVAGMGDALPPKTLGLGILVDGQSVFIPADVIGDGFTLKTDDGEISARFVDGGIEVTGAPDRALTSQTFYYSWSAFNPQTRVVGE